MTKQNAWLAIAAAGATLLTVTGARADVKIVQNVSISNPQLDAMLQSASPEQKAQMAKMGLAGNSVKTGYMSGRKSRYDLSALTSIIADLGANKVYTLNRGAHTYSAQPYSAMAGRASGKGMNASLMATGKTKKILGHVCRSYHLSLTSASMPGSIISGDIWAAPDLPQPFASVLSAGPLAALQSQWKKIKGMPLQVLVTVSGSPVGNTTVKMTTRAISTGPLPASVFAIPTGYKPVAPGANRSMGGMMGGMGR